MSNVSLGTVFGEAFELVKRDYLLHVVSVVIIGAVGALTYGLLSGPFMVGYFRALKDADEGRGFQLGRIFSGFDGTFAISLITVILCGIIVAIGFFLLLIPGLLVLALTPAAGYLIAIRGQRDVIGIIKAAWKANAANLLNCTLTMIALTILGSLGAILFGIGVIFTMPLLYVGAYVLAKHMLGDGTDAAVV